MKPYLEPAFLICAVVLAASAGAMSGARAYFGMRRVKLPLPLKQPFHLMDKAALAPFEVVEEKEIDNPDVLEQLGTEDYIQWVLEDTEAAPDSAARFCFLFVTYYTGSTQQVWHTPEECYFGGGNIKYDSDNLTLRVNFKDEAGLLSEGSRVIVDSREIPVRRVVFGPRGFDGRQAASKFTVSYTFNANGAYIASRTGVRINMEMNLTAKYSYFSKVEWKFFNTRFGQTTYLSSDEIDAASKKLLAVILPVLEKECWPEWPVVNSE